ncbi:tetratricopeptide repeat protein [Plantactinospora sp. GCM10030261]|uniref:tetratricopeptide repeat protein n=1 Tax=Plantactinospora sp. GCM10030261 TaxID=3273420 RepID=UPI00360BC88D
MDDPRLSAEGELAMARLALDEGDLTHAAGHVAGAIAHAPTLPEVHEVLAQLAARTGGALDLFTLDQQAFIGTVVARAHLLAAAGRPAEGLELLVAATGHAPTMDWAGVPWLDAPGVAEACGQERIVRLLLQVCAAVPDPVPAADRPALRPYLRLAERAVEAYPGQGLLFGAASALARRLGETDLAVRWASRGVRLAPAKLTEVWLGYALRSAGRVDEALAALRRAVDRDPDDLSVYADIAGTMADDGQLDEALRWIDRALERNPTFDCAVHTGYRLRYRADGSLAHLVALADFHREHPDDTHEHNDLAECCAGQPWLGRVPPATEAVVGVLRRLRTAGPGLPRQRPGDSTPAVAGERRGQVRMTGLEPPSAMLALGTAAPGLAVTVATVAEPDIRRPRRPVQRHVWRYDGTAALPAVPEPTLVAVDRIRWLAQPGWAHPPAAYDGAVALATLTLDDLLGLLVHPPPPPATPLGDALVERDPALWARCVQVWACLGLLHHRTDEPWATSTRRTVLLELVWGVEDWITEAALFALVAYAWVDPTVRSDVARVAAERLADAVTVARTRPVSILGSLARLVLATPAMDPAVVTATRRMVAADRPGWPVGVRRGGGFRWLGRLWRRITRSSR